MDEVPVVTVFLRNRGEVLLLRRSEAVGSYRGLWGGVAGHVETEAGGASRGSSGEGSEPRDWRPDAAAHAEIAEETGLDDHVALVRRGEPFPVVDEDRGTRWLVHPYLFDCDSRAVEPNEETSEWEWVAAPEIRRRETSEASASDGRTRSETTRETVPGLWSSYDRVRPRVETVVTDGTHGSAYLSARALEVLRDEAALAAERDGSYADLASVARDLRDVRPSMQAVANRINRAMATADPSPAGVERAANETLERALEADDAAAAAAADLVDGTVLTLSRSGTVAAAFDRASPHELLVLASRPGGEGIDVAEAFADLTDVTLFADAAVAHVLATRAVDAVVVGADTVLPDGRVVNKVGTRTAAVAAAREAVPVYAVCARDKIAPDGEPVLESGDPSVVYDGEADVNVENPTFDVTPADLVSGVVTEGGVLDADEVRAAAEELAELAAWDA